MPELGWELFSDREKEGLLAGMRSGAADDWPRTIQIDWTDRCNIDCFFCSQREMRKGGDELDLEVLRRCFDEMDSFGARTLNVAGGGDPLFHREIAAILEEVAASRFRIGTLTTNGVLARGRVTELLLRATREQISISLNSFGSADYARVMRTAARNYDRVLDNIRSLVECRRVAGTGPRLAVQFLVHDGTFRQIPAMVELASELGVDRVGFNPLQFYDDRSRELKANPEEFLSVVASAYQSDARGIIADIRCVDPEINRRIDALRRDIVPDRYPQADLRHRNFDALQSFCPLPWFNMHVRPSGDVYPCCALLVPGFSPFGNVRERSLGEVWQGEPYRKFRMSHASFIRGVRAGDPRADSKSGLPAVCTRHGACFLRALPYLDDTPFAVSVDALARSEEQAEVAFPESFSRNVPARLAGTVPGSHASPEQPLFVRVNRVPCGVATRKGDRFKFEFDHSPLGQGFHLLDVVDSRGRILAARMVEKTAPH